MLPTDSGLMFYESGNLSGPVIVLGHALGGDSHMWDEVAELLEPNWKVLRWDQPGHGASLLPKQATNIQAAAEQLLSALDELKVGQVHLAGISLGAMISMAAAAADPQRVKSLSVLDSLPALKPADVWTKRAEFARTNGMTPLVDSTMERWFAPEIIQDDRRVSYDRTKATFLACNAEGYAQCCELIGATDLTADLMFLTMPTLVLTGQDDASAPPAQIKTMAKSMPGASPVVIIPGARHITCLHDPSAVAQRISAVAASTDR